MSSTPICRLHVIIMPASTKNPSGRFFFTARGDRRDLISAPMSLGSFALLIGKMPLTVLLLLAFFGSCTSHTLIGMLQLSFIPLPFRPSFRLPISSIRYPVAVSFVAPFHSPILCI